MSQPIDRAFVEILPDFDDFEASAKRQIAAQLRQIARDAERAANDVEDSFEDSGRGVERAFDGIGRSADHAFRDVERGAKRAGGSLGDMDGQLRDSRDGFVAMGKHASDSLEDVGDGAKGVSQALAGLGAKGGVPGIVALGAAAAIAAGPLAALASALADLAGLAALIPAAIGVGASAIIALTLSFHGFGDAVSAVASGDLDKIKESMAKLAPSARSVVKEFAAMLPQLKAIQRSVQQSFFAPLQGSLSTMAMNLLPSVNKGLSDVARAFGNVGASIASFLSGPETLKFVNDALATTARIVNSLQGPAMSLFNGFVSAGTALLPTFEKIAIAVGKIAGNFGDWLADAASTGKLQEFVDDALATLKELIALGKSVGNLFVAVFGDLDDSGRDFIGTLTDVVDKMTAFFESAEGKQQIQDTITVVKTLGGALLVLTDILTFLQKSGAFFGPFDKAAKGLADMGGDIADAWSAVGEFFTDLWSDITDGFHDLVEVISDFVGSVVDFVGTIPAKIGAFLSSLPGIISKFFSDAFDQAFLMVGIGIGLIIAAVTRLPGLIVDTVKSLPGKIMAVLEPLPGLLGGFFSGLWENIKTGAVTAFDNVVGFVKALPGRLLDAGRAVVSAVTGFFSRAFDGAKQSSSNAISNIIGFVKGLPGRLTSFVKDVGGDIARVFINMLNRAISKINEGIGKVDAVLPGDLPRIPSLADGGIASPTPGGRIVRVAEAGQAEAIAPLDKLMAMIQNAVGGGGITFAPGAISVQFDGSVPTPQQAFAVGQGIGDGIASTIQRRNIRTQVRTI